jgi:hypothetical protein
VQVLGYSMAEKLRPMIDYLVEEVGVPAESIPMLVQRCPKLLGCSIDRNLRPTLRFLQDEVVQPLLDALFALYAL